MLDKNTGHTDSVDTPGQAESLKHLHGNLVAEIIRPWNETKDIFVQNTPLTEGMNDVLSSISKITGESGITAENIIAIPWHYKEESHRILQVIEKMKGEFVVVIYFNGADLDDKEEFNIRYQDLIRIIERDNLVGKVIIAKHIYPKRAPLGAIRGDMIGGIIQSASENLKDPIIIGFDADTYDVSDNYIENLRSNFDEDTGIDFLRSQLRWTNGSHDGFIWLSEMMMHLAVLAKNRKHVVSMGGATSFRLRSYIRIGGYKRDLDMGEDIILGKDLKETNPPGGRKFGGKIYVDPRRGIQSIHEGKRFQDQWAGMKQYDFVEKDTIFSNDMITALSAMVKDLAEGGEIPEIDLKQFSGHLDGHYFVGRYKKRIQELFLKFWNISLTKSQYKAMIDDHGKVVFAKK